ncbi:MAG: Eco57I restriction-modification methylase domain-containing protein, partial [Thermogutta sp.]
MPLNTARVKQYLKDFDVTNLFTQELGWDRHKATLEVTVDGRKFMLSAVAQKRGMVAFQCPAPDGEPIPLYSLRRKIEQHVARSVHEHLVIFTDAGRTTQVWQWMKREAGRPAACREHTFHRNQPGDALIQKLRALEVTLEEEENLTIVDAVGKAKAAFDVDKVTKKFYDRFKAEHAAFTKFIKGIRADADLQWYTSLMLNRLMFVYFIQKKGFLDGDLDYLRNRLAMVRQVKGKDKFQSFYRYFLLRLFHDGLGKSPDERKLDAAMEKLLGKVPFLNGGFFEVHQLEEHNPDIDIPDEAFEKLFDFFDQYSWHLDERPLRADNEINPDVVGYIFEKYVNQKQMGAYYTKEDITEYISKNTIIPFLFDAAEKKCAIAFQPDSALWRLLRDDPDRYIYPAVRHGVVDDKGNIIPLPKEIEAGIKDVAKRDGWNKTAADPFGLPTETWREHVARRQRCLELRRKLAGGEVHQINDLITLNLDIRQFDQDAVETCEGPELLRAFYHAITSVSVLDPTCGSGAFLFAALNILEPLYEACLARMQAFLNELDRGAVPIFAADESIGRSADDAAAKMGLSPSAPRRTSPKKFDDFRKALAQVGQHPNQRYFILKSIIINNLFGGDIMEEAVEICKLRLFLKLVAQVERVEQIEPLPDIDFNIRAGNTLVGYATLDQVRKSQEGKLGFGADEVRRIEEEADLVERAFTQFRAQQTTHGGRVTHRDKQKLRRRLENLTDQLDRFLAGEYGVNLQKPKNFEAWKASHQPFHWFAEFYGIMRAGGFDVIIGNPPYVEYRKVKGIYAIPSSEYRSAPAENLYAFCVGRSAQLLHCDGKFGMIIPSSAVGLDDTRCLRDLLADRYRCLWYSTYSIRPAKLFEGVDQRLCIVLGDGASDKAHALFTTRYRHWNSEERASLFATLAYIASFVHPRLNRIAQIGDPIAKDILLK